MHLCQVAHSLWAIFKKPADDQTSTKATERATRAILRHSDRGWNLLLKISVSLNVSFCINALRTKIQEWLIDMPNSSALVKDFGSSDLEYIAFNAALFLPFRFEETSF